MTGRYLDVYLDGRLCGRLAQSTSGNVLTKVVGPLGVVPRRLAREVSGIAISYPAPRNAHRIAGHRAVDIPLDFGPARLYEALRSRRFVLLSRTDVSLRVDAWNDRVDTVTADDAIPASTVLVRPDGYVAWATDETAGPALDEAVRGALRRWCGSPVPT